MRDELPHEVYVADADFVQVAMKTLTAQRTAGWLREYADYCDVAGKTTTAKHARMIADRFEAEAEADGGGDDA